MRLTLLQRLRNLQKDLKSILVDESWHTNVVLIEGIVRVATNLAAECEMLADDRDGWRRSGGFRTPYAKTMLETANALLEVSEAMFYTGGPPHGDARSLAHSAVRIVEARERKCFYGTPRYSFREQLFRIMDDHRIRRVHLVHQPDAEDGRPHIRICSGLSLAYDNGKRVL